MTKQKAARNKSSENMAEKATTLHIASMATGGGNYVMKDGVAVLDVDSVTKPALRKSERTAVERAVQNENGKG